MRPSCSHRRRRSSGAWTCSPRRSAQAYTATARWAISSTPRSLRDEGLGHWPRSSATRSASHSRCTSIGERRARAAGDHGVAPARHGRSALRIARAAGASATTCRTRCQTSRPSPSIRAIWIGRRRSSRRRCRSFSVSDDRWGIQGCLEPPQPHRPDFAATEIERPTLARETSVDGVRARQPVADRGRPPVSRPGSRALTAAAASAQPASRGATAAIRTRPPAAAPRPASSEEAEAEPALLREALGDAAFEAAWEAGRAMSVDQAMRYALEEIDVDPGGPRAWPS